MSTHIHGPLGALLVAGFFLDFSGVIRLLKKDLEHVQMLVGLQWFVVIKLYHSSLCSSV